MSRTIRPGDALALRGRVMDAIREDVEQSGGGLIDSDDGVVSEKSKARVSGINDSARSAQWYFPPQIRADCTL